MGKPTCPMCKGAILPTDIIVPFKGRKAHKRCFDTYIAQASRQEKKPKKKDNTSKETNDIPKISIPVSEAEYKEKKAVVEYIEQLTNQRATAKVYKLLEDYSKKYNFTYIGMLRGLQYFYEALENSPEGDCVGILPYIYEEAQAYMDKIDEAANNNRSVTSKELNQMYPKVKLKIKKKEETPSLIDIGSIK